MRESASVLIRRGLDTDSLKIIFRGFVVKNDIKTPMLTIEANDKLKYVLQTVIQDEFANIKGSDLIKKLFDKYLSKSIKYVVDDTGNELINNIQIIGRSLYDIALEIAECI